MALTEEEEQKIIEEVVLRVAIRNEGGGNTGESKAPKRVGLWKTDNSETSGWDNLALALLIVSVIMFGVMAFSFSTMAEAHGYILYLTSVAFGGAIVIFMVSIKEDLTRFDWIKNLLILGMAVLSIYVIYQLKVEITHLNAKIVEIENILKTIAK